MRFPEFTGEWEETILGKCVTQPLDYGMNAAAIAYDGENKYIRITDIDEQSSQYISDDPVSPAGQLLDKYIVEENDILFARTGASTGKTYLYKKKDGKLYFAGFLIRAKIKTEYNSAFIFAQTKTAQYYKWVEFMSIRSGQPGINSQEYASYRFLIPQKEEQDKIATFLSLLDSRIEAQIKIIEDLKLLKKELLKKVFFQELRLPEFNENWKIVTLSDVGTFFSGGTPSTSIGQYYNGNIPFIKSGEINADNTEQFISEEGLRNSSAKMVEIGDLIYALYGATSGEVGISKIKGAINQAILCIRTNLNSIFLLNFLMFKKEEILRTYLQGGQGNLSAEIIKSLKIPAPVYAEQTKLSHLFSAFDKKIELETNVMTKFMQQKQYLLANLLI
ncbi:restriction endonuclease subunit S [Bacteroides xylanisolvens]|uniref:Restriction endonuclease subunit S n=1 Tax=Bacteroides xylanisolvens TaxID=371601 RepID=A0A7J5Q1K4_9BACE|nr:restriction endonuclease subunit S [Bacteroides xylanisolvens]KAB6149686.1 restriction endonuclease subunit S [Bacteroides xylanisolvens]